MALVIGGFGPILVASLAYLGPEPRGGGQRLTAGFAITRSWLSLLDANAAAIGALVGHGLIVVAAPAVWLTDLVVRAVRLFTSIQAEQAHV